MQMVASALAPDIAKKKTIVLVEDEEVILELLRAKLQSAGIIVYTARDGIAGLQLIKEIKPDLVLLDMLLPGMNGLRVLEGMHAAGLLPAMPVFIISNSGQPVELARAMELGVRDYLIKVNFDPGEILNRVRAILGAASPQHTEDGSVSGKRILVIEDDILLSDLLERKLAADGYGVLRAFDADQARRAIAKERIDAVLLDLVLPGSDGFSLLGEIKRDERVKHVPVVIISNLGQEEEVDKGMRMGATDYIVKANISPAQIVKKIVEILK